MTEYDKVNLSISSKKLECDEILKFLYASKIRCSIIKNKSVVYKNKKWTMENGCNIHLYHVNKDDIKNRVWRPIQKKNNLGCAHLNIPDVYSGCVSKYL
ncbi:hypothetical protein N9T73_00290 [bacterium]|nr:hypothetical protein [bacterium]